MTGSGGNGGAARGGRRLDVVDAMLRRMTDEVVRPLLASRLAGDDLARERSERRHDLAMQRAVLRDDRIRALPAPGAVDLRVRRHDVAAAELRRSPLATERQHREALPRKDVAQRVLDRPGLAPEPLERRFAKRRSREASDGAVERAILSLDPRDEAGSVVADRSGHGARLPAAEAMECSRPYAP